MILPGSGQGRGEIDGWSREWLQALPVRSPLEEARLLEEVHSVILELQRSARAGGESARALHAHGIHATRKAHLTIRPDLPESIRLGPLQPGTTWPVLVRFSNAYPRVQPEEAPDQRGLAVRLVDDNRRLDLLATTGEAHHASDAWAMIASLRAAAVAARGGVIGKAGAVARLVRRLGIADGLRMARTVSRARDSGLSLASLSYYSRAPFQLGDFAVRYRFAPAPGVDPSLRGHGDDALLQDLLWRIRQGPVRWTLELQGFLDPVKTPMDDHRIRWSSPWRSIGEFVLEAAGLDLALAQEGTRSLSRGADFRAEPDWHDPGGAVFTPLGDLNRLRAVAYRASSTGRAVS